MTKVRVDVSVDDIRFGKPNAPCHCPVARALRRVLPNDTAVNVRSHYVWIGPFPKHKRYDLPIEVSGFIKQFDDHNLGLLPFSFELDLEMNS